LTRGPGKNPSRVVRRYALVAIFMLISPGSHSAQDICS
jgi:hypothetical protein